MRKLIAVLSVIGGVIVSTTSPAAAGVERYNTTTMVGDCPSAVGAQIHKPRLVSQSPLNLAIGVAAGRSDTNPQEPCATIHDHIHVEAALWFLPIGGAPGSVVAVGRAAGDCKNAQTCTAFHSGIHTPGYYQVVGKVVLSDGTGTVEKGISTGTFLYDGLEITPFTLL